MEDKSRERTYFHNVDTGETTWDVPDEIKALEKPTTEAAEAAAPTKKSVKVLGDWVEILDEASGNPYFHNRKTGEITWTRPSQ